MYKFLVCEVYEKVIFIMQVTVKTGSTIHACIGNTHYVSYGKVIPHILEVKVMVLDE